MNLKTKLFLSFSFIALVSVSLGIFVSLQLYSKKIRQDAVADMEMLGNLARHTYKDILRGAREQTVGLSNNQALRVMLRYQLTAGNFKKLLHKFLQEHDLDAVAVHDEQGALITRVAAPELAAGFPREPSIAPGEEPTLGFVGEQNAFFLRVSAPIYFKGSLVGTMVSFHHLNWPNNDLLVHKLSQLLRVETALYLERREVNRRGNLPAPTPAQFDTLLQGNTPGLRRIDFQVGGYIQNFLPLKDLRGNRVGVIGIGLPATRYVSLTRQAYVVFLSLLLGCLVIAGLLGYALGRAILVPIDRLTEGVRKIIRDKDLSYRIHVAPEARDELSILASAFNRMTSRLHELVTNLEDVVEMRTKEVVHLNDRLKRENLRMSAQLEIPRKIQHMVMPRSEELMRLSAYDIAGVMKAAEQVGGDYFDVLYHDREGGRIKVGIGDITGHGLESGLLMLMVQVAVRTLFVLGENDPKQFLATLNQVIFHNLKRMDIEKNLTLSLVDIEYRTGKILATGQHEELLFIRGGQVERVDTTDLGFMVGMERDISSFIGGYETTLEPGDGLVMYTDGVTEAFNQQRQQYGVERLCQQIQRLWPLPAEQIKDCILEDLKSFATTFKDDISLVIVKRK